ncbi:cop9 signalosome complex subunit 6a [Phtheirospermum japonicum]|uniref:Cop9 signalosome complex subunit 6a n=1 Tax=Phtheirospermum japonicum TaxID=374723 RepID=A0A830CEJ5_9LAMI|nr:cop9 signalosome complex subunit 6a [Phtheirospermum japonicum]
MASSSSSDLTFKLHPLVIVNISDHHTRVKSQYFPPPATPHAGTDGGDSSPLSSPPPPRVFECVIGVQLGRTVGSSTVSSYSTTHPPIHSTALFSRKSKSSIRRCFQIFTSWDGTHRGAMRRNPI